MLKIPTIIGLLLFLSTAVHAQDIGAIMGDTAAQQFADNGAPDAAVDWNIFQWAYQATMGPIDGSVNQVMAGIRTWASALVIAAAVVAMAVYFLNAVINLDDTSNLIGHLMRFGLPISIVLTVIASVGSLHNWIIDPLRQLPVQILAAANGIPGEKLQAGGAQFDAISQMVWTASGQTLKHVSGPINAIIYGPIIILAALFEELCIGVAFIAWLLTNALLSIVLVPLSPIAISCAAYAQSRHIAKGWFSVVSGLIGTMVLQSIILSVALVVVRHVTEPLVNAPPTAAIFSMIASLFQACVVILILAACALQVRHVAYGIFGWSISSATAAGRAVAGAYHDAQSVGRALGGGGGGSSGGGGGAAPATRPAFRTLGPNMSGGD